MQFCTRIVNLCKKMGKIIDFSDICRTFARNKKGKVYETIRRISALRRKYREGQGL